MFVCQMEIACMLQKCNISWVGTLIYEQTKNGSVLLCIKWDPVLIQNKKSLDGLLHWQPQECWFDSIVFVSLHCVHYKFAFSGKRVWWAFSFFNTVPWSSCIWAVKNGHRTRRTVSFTVIITRHVKRLLHDSCMHKAYSISSVHLTDLVWNWSWTTSFSWIVG